MPLSEQFLTDPYVILDPAFAGRRIVMLICAGAALIVALWAALTIRAPVRR